MYTYVSAISLNNIPLSKVINFLVSQKITHFQFYSSIKPNADFSWLHRKVSYEHFIVIDSLDYQIHIDPLFDLQVGKDADVLIFDDEINIKMTMVKGNVIVLEPCLQ